MGKSLVSCFLRHSVYNGPVSVMSLRPSIQSTDSGNGGFAAQFPAGRRYRSTTAAGAGAQQQTRQRHVESRWRKACFICTPCLSLCWVRQLPHLTRHYTVLAVVLVSLFIALGSVLC